MSLLFFIRAFAAIKITGCALVWVAFNIGVLELSESTIACTLLFHIGIGFLFFFLMGIKRHIWTHEATVGLANFLFYFYFFSFLF